MIEVASTNFLKVSGVNINATVHTTSFNSDAFVVAHARGFAIEAVFSGTTTGTIKLQASNDPASPNAAPSSGSWVDIAASVFDLASGSPFLWNVTDHQYTFVRIAHTDTGGGDLTLTARITTKG
jgi:hypothetical protein